MLLIRTGGVELRGARRPGETGYIVRKDGLRGWGALPASRREALERAMQDGEFDLPTYLPARVVTVEGIIYAKDEHDLIRKCDAFTALGARGDRDEFSVQQLGRTRHAYGRRVVAEAEPTRPHIFRGEFQLQMVFAKPQKYEAIVRYPVGDATTIVRAESMGNFPAHPVIEIPNGPSSWSVSTSAGTFTVTGVSPGGTHAVDMATGRVTRDGVYQPGAGTGPLWSIPPAGRMTHELSAPGWVWVSPTFV